ncbi:Mis12-domain-containing protein [Rhizophagus irregularis]|uniref:Mis12-domain-containing protein n=4 Tax=Rhizophagus irregularis TaxID=588596 RepID=A0A2N0RWY0_9GLOM|nr:centromere Mis12 protein [Rhizophagus irregularis DAOM 181602=DAOM 197198]EXX71147.1 Mtw1p [Rhizophagus irregularis DAOM 197198w]PKC09502.1 Mis12-domain-containing protein [Rhizophagus irregularis]PKC67782.1 Mis12-domain-containing protein [Rhizophagus irregularis]POG77396.1 centromere Mis12 protein [Rhizophagus irregularis DAOM 181602=DAOM 197198]|eukprot:XP_025184262.1 centromere Mis12 protein [Rhizophagus irregularis DAOM 181602=DAOM 197198]
MSQQQDHHVQEEQQQPQQQYQIQYQKISKLLELVSDSEEEDTDLIQPNNQITCLNDIAIRNEIITEHFGFLPISFVDDIINSINELIYIAIAGMDNFVNSELKNKKEVEQGTHQIETLLENLVDKYFERFEIYTLHKILAIRENVTVVLKHNEGVNFNVDESVEVETDKEIELLRKKIMAAKCFNLKLKKQLIKYDIQIERLKRTENKISFLRTAAKAHNASPLSDTLRFVTDQLMAIKKMYYNLDESAKEENLKQYENMIDEREKFISMMVLRQTEKERSLTRRKEC